MTKLKPTPEKPEKNAAAVALGKLRWVGISAEERSRHMRAINDLSGGRPRDESQRRCPCGNMTLKRAKARAGARDGKSYGHKRSCPFYKPDPKGRIIMKRAPRRREAA